MAESCCNLRCFSYFVAVLTIIGGILQVAHLDPSGIIGGLISAGIGLLLFIGTRKENKQYVLGYVITEAVLLIIGLILCIVGLTSINKSHLDDDHKEVLQTVFYANIGGIVITFLLLIPVFFYYKQLARKNDAQEDKI